MVREINYRHVGNPLSGREYRHFRITGIDGSERMIWGYEDSIGWHGWVVESLEPAPHHGLEITWQRKLHTGEVIK
jgi:hypothetical protein